jgi:hypothetical protein
MGRVKLATEPSRIDSLTAYFRTRVLPANTLNGELTDTVQSGRSLSIPAPRPVGRMVSGMSLLLHRLKRDDDLFPSLQVFHLDHTVGISGLQKQRALQSVVLPVAVESLDCGANATS